MKRALVKEGGRFTIFGGEPLLTPWDDLEELCRFGYEKFKGSGMQTDGALMTDRHIRMFVRYKVQPSFSIDGPGKLNDARWLGSIQKTREGTDRSCNALSKCLEAGIRTSVIVTMHRGNSSRTRLPKLIEWLHELSEIGVKNVRIHSLEIDTERAAKSWALTTGEQMFAWDSIIDALGDELHISEWEDIKSKLLKGPVGGTCVWNGCDPLTTPAVRGVNSQGERSNCHRTDSDGIMWNKADKWGGERYLALFQTPQIQGGCAGCRYWYACTGQCPGTAIDKDWRNRSRDCAVWLHLFERAERELMAAAKDTNRLPTVAVPAARAAAEAHVLLGMYHNDPFANRKHGDSHGDKHGDHTDHGR
jgi:uncharacterized protein